MHDDVGEKPIFALCYSTLLIELHKFKNVFRQWVVSYLSPFQNHSCLRVSYAVSMYDDVGEMTFDLKMLKAVYCM